MWRPDSRSAQSLPYPSRATLLFRSVWPYIPDRLLRLVKYIPTKDHIHFRRTLDTIESYSKVLVHEKTKAVFGDTDSVSEKQDLMSIIGKLRHCCATKADLTAQHSVRANTSEDPEHRLSDEEMISQMATFLLQGEQVIQVYPSLCGRVN